jgi:uncharacterized LabA/DUF88 family protein
MNRIYLNDELSTSVLIDGINTHYAFKNLGWAPDYKKLLKYLNENTLLRKVYYFITIDSRNEDNSIMKLLDWLDYNGYNVRITDTDDRRKGIEVDLAVEAMALAPVTDQFILFTGNSQYVPLARKLDSMGKVVVICSTLLNQRMASDALRRAADHFIELDHLRSYIENEERKNNVHSTNHTSTHE